jgi:hypothetical protein
MYILNVHLVYLVGFRSDYSYPYGFTELVYVYVSKLIHLSRKTLISDIRIQCYQHSRNGNVLKRKTVGYIMAYATLAQSNRFVGCVL